MVMDLEPDEEATMADKLKLFSLKKEVMASVLSAGVRVNDTALRRKETDKVAQLLRKVKGEKPLPDKVDDEEERVRNELFR